jgi:hypothetical protein
MAAVQSDRIGAHSDEHDRRVLAWMHARAADTLAGRTVWSAATGPAGREAAARLRVLLCGDSTIHLLPESTIREQARAEPGGGLALVPGDVVVIHDALALDFAQTVREHGGHAIWQVPDPRGTRSLSVAAVRAYLNPDAPAVDAVIASSRPGRRRARAERVIALVPAAGLVVVKDADLGAPRGELYGRLALAWLSALGDVLEDGHDDRVGGTLHARPLVASR